ncbi:hypothetical protein GOEFS_017_00220 [Gordonia effusa NBRC 100432]|uniref:Uncharacterized protein n=1 Tax=Gordonia effusa NBRC 100432 TaxID=1077974 RepID=H0QVQ4_9ACTN|nr:hypothetical protein [Gordonia effusa]GAB16905.1 hypothetical protein GOEFS_017_00220 [Gordonia effusa NBRC 100432]
MWSATGYGDAHYLSTDLIVAISDTNEFGSALVDYVSTLSAVNRSARPRYGHTSWCVADD